MSDSRSYSLSKLKLKIQRQTKVIMFLLSIILSFVLVYFLRSDDFTTTQDYTLFLLFFSIGLWITEAIPPFAVGIMIIGFLVFFMGNMPGVDVKKYVNTWSDSVIWLFLGGFFLAEAMKKTRLDEQLLHLVTPKLGNKASRVLLGVMMITALLSMLMSNTATTAMVLATISPLIVNLGKDSPTARALVTGIPAAASIGGMGTIIGSAPNAIAVGALEAIGIRVSFVEWMLIGVPVTLILILSFHKVLCRKYKLKGETIPTETLTGIPKEERDQDDKNQRVIVLLVMILTVSLWLTSQWTKIPVAVVSGIPIMLLTMLEVIDPEDVRKLSWDTLMLVAGGLSLGLAIQEQGIASYFVSHLNGVSINYYALVFFMAFVTVSFSNFMSNTATATIFIPVGISLLNVIPGGNATVLTISIGLSASCAMLLPVSTPPNAIAYSTGIVKQKEFYTGGLFVGIVGPLVIILLSILVSLMY